MIKKTVCLFISMLILMSMLSSLSVCAASEDIYLINEFTESDEIPTNGAFSTDHYLLEDRSWQFSYSIVSETNMKMSLKGATDLDEYSYLNFLVYSEKAASDEYYTVRLNTTHPRKSGSGVCYLYYNFYIDWEGWKLISIPKSDIKKQYAASGVNLWPYLDDELAFYHTWGGKATAKTAVVYFDRIWMSKELPGDNTIKASSPISGDKYVGIDTNQITAEFSNGIRKINDAEKISVKTGDTALNVTANLDDKENLVITLNESLKKETNYTVTIGEGALLDEFGQLNKLPLEMNFKTLGNVPVVKQIGFSVDTMPSTGTVNASCVATNPSDEDVALVCITALYNKETNSMSVADRQDAVLGTNEEKAFNASFAADPASNASMMVFILKNGNYYPLSPIVAEIE